MAAMNTLGGEELSAALTAEKIGHQRRLQRIEEVLVSIAGIQAAGDGSDVMKILVAVSFAVLILIVASYAAQIRRDRRAELAETAEASFLEPVDPFAGGHPVPPMPGQDLLEPARVPAVEQEPRNA